MSVSSESRCNGHTPKPPSGVAKPAFVRRSRRSSSSKLPMPLKMVSSFSDVSIDTEPANEEDRQSFLPKYIPGSRRHSIHQSRVPVPRTPNTALGRFHPLPAIPTQNPPCSDDSVADILDSFRRHTLRSSSTPRSSPRVSADSGRWSGPFQSPVPLCEPSTNGPLRCTLCSPDSHTRSRSVDDRKHFKRMARFLRCIETPLRRQLNIISHEDIIGIEDIPGQEPTEDSQEKGDDGPGRLIRSNTYDVIPVNSKKLENARSQSVVNAHRELSPEEEFNASTLPKRPSTTVLVPSVAASVQLALRLPSGERVYGQFNQMDSLWTVLRFAERSSTSSLPNHILMANGAPIKLYANLGLTLSELGLTNRTLLYVVKERANMGCDAHI